MSSILFKILAKVSYFRGIYVSFSLEILMIIGRTCENFDSYIGFFDVSVIQYDYYIVAIT